jgi:lipopolysaccharide/colanic/teichoic acid biosynthesis glycosyltransferase
VIIEDGSIDGTCDRISALNLKNLKLIKLQNGGAAKARNIGIENATKEVLVFLDQDLVLDSELFNCYDALFSNTTAEVAQGNIWEQIIKTPITALHSKWRHRVFLEKTSLGEGGINTIITRNVAIRKKVLNTVKQKYGFVFDEHYNGTGGEDRELGYRIFKLGYKIVLEPKAIVCHKDPDNYRDILDQKYRHARGDVRQGIGEYFWDLKNFKRTVLAPLVDRVPIYFSLPIWGAHVYGAEIERIHIMLSNISIRIFYFLKRIMDITGSLIGITLGSPLLLTIAVLIKNGSAGPVIFKQRRIGLRGKEFEMYKFRTMVINAENILQNNPELLELYKKNSYKIKEDPRVTKIGKFLRKSSLDELPQLINILKGEMSIVGPRAYKKDEMDCQLELHPELRNNAEYVINTKPGLTGVWQISGRSEIGFEKRILLDYQYAIRRDIFFDIQIILKTIPVVLKSKGAW